MNVPAAEWEWFGNAAHFMGGPWCRFHLATKVGNYLVSTIGEWVHPYWSRWKEEPRMDGSRAHLLGDALDSHGHRFKTAVFLARERCESAACGCTMPQPSGRELDSAGYNTRAEATRGHMALCHTWAEATKHQDKESA
jgi:hypothetical protein